MSKCKSSKKTPWGNNWYWSGFLAFPNQLKLTRGQTRNSGKTWLEPLMQWNLEEPKRVTGSFACSQNRAQACSLNGVRVGAHLGFPGGSVVKNLPANTGAKSLLLGPGRRKWQPSSVFFAWEIPRTGEPGGLRSTGSQRVGQKQLSTHSGENSSLI